jgi:hypothetical protein
MALPIEESPVIRHIHFHTWVPADQIAGDAVRDYDGTFDSERSNDEVHYYNHYHVEIYASGHRGFWEEIRESDIHDVFYYNIDGLENNHEHYHDWSQCPEIITNDSS